MAPAQTWEIVGGSEKGGIIVREGESIKSPELSERLSTGALVEELELKGDRLHYKRLTGTGPVDGWVSTKVTGKELAVRSDKQIAATNGDSKVAADSKAEPPLPIGLFFPGQGSQYVKMLTNVKDLPAVQEMLTKSREILGYDILDLCLNGPEEKLEETRHCQPAMFIGGLAGRAFSKNSLTSVLTIILLVLTIILK